MFRFSRALVSVVLAVASGCLFSIQAAPAFRITETYGGVTGEDGTVDWLEVSNLGVMVGDTGTLLYDDENPSVANAGTLDSFLLSPGESAVFLLDDQPVDDVTYTTAAAEFQAVWGAVANLGQTNGGGNIGQNGDQLNIGIDDAGDFFVIDTLAFDAALGGELQTIEDPTGTAPRLSVPGENGAYQSAAFFNDNLGAANDLIQLVGSPGVVPEPSSLVCIVGAAVGWLSRRRPRAIV